MRLGWRRGRSAANIGLQHHAIHLHHTNRAAPVPPIKPPRLTTRRAYFISRFPLLWRLGIALGLARSRFRRNRSATHGPSSLDRVLLVARRTLFVAARALPSKAGTQSRPQGRARPCARAVAAPADAQRSVARGERRGWCVASGRQREVSSTLAAARATPAR